MKLVDLTDFCKSGWRQPATNQSDGSGPERSGLEANITAAPDFTTSRPSRPPQVAPVHQMISLSGFCGTNGPTVLLFVCVWQESSSQPYPPHPAQSPVTVRTLLYLCQIISEEVQLCVLTCQWNETEAKFSLFQVDLVQIYFIESTELSQLTVNWSWISPVAAPCTPSIRTRRASWTSMRVTSSSSLTKSTPTGTKARSAANQDCFPSAMWTCWCLCRYHDDASHVPGVWVWWKLVCFLIICNFLAPYLHFFTNRELWSRATGKVGHKFWSHVTLKILPAAELRLAQWIRHFQMIVRFPFNVFISISAQTFYIIVHFNSHCRPALPTSTGMYNFL